MYLEVKDLKKSYGEGGGYVQVLKGITAGVEQGEMCVIQGTSGSGKSTLVNETLRPILSKLLYRSYDQPLEYDSVEGTEHIDKLVVVDQSPIGRSPRSNPATYSNVFSDIRKLFEMTPDAQIRGFKAGRFSFNVKGGRFLTSGGMGTMGYSLPCGIGAKLASPESLVISVCGDGAFQMSMMELATLVQHNVPVKIILMTNTRLGMVRELQTKNYADNQVAVHLDGNPDFIKLADAYGIATYRLDSPENEDMVIDRLINDKEAFFVECIVSPDESTL